MKKIFYILLSLLMITPAHASLYEYYQAKNQKLPSISQRANVAVECGMSDYQGTISQNIKLEKCLRDSSGLLGITPIKTIALYSDNLLNSISNTATSFTLVSGVDKQGNSLNGLYGFIIDEGSTNEEFVIATCVATVCTSATRGISVSDGKTSVTALKKAHRRGAEIKITDFPIVGRLNSIISGSESTGSSTFKIGDSTTSTNQTIQADNGVTNLPFVRYNNSLNKWQFSDDGVNTVNFATSSAAGLSASTTRGIGITNSQILINASSTKGMTFDASGNLYQLTSSTLAIESDSNGIYLNTSTLLNLVASTTATANKLPIADSNGEINTWLNENRLNVQNYTAGENINASVTPQAVYLKQSDGRVYKLSATTASETLYAFIGFAILGQNITTGNTIKIQTNGQVSGFSGLTTSTLYYGTNTAGTVSSTAGTISYKIARAISSDKLLIEKGKKIVSGNASFNASGSTVITTGFKPSVVKINAVGAPSLSMGGWSVNGGNNTVYNYNDSITDSNNSAWYIGLPANTHIGMVNTITDTGFTLTNTKTGAPSDVIIFYIAEE